MKYLLYRSFGNLDKDVKKHIGSYVENIVNVTIHKNAELLKN